ncbi:MAG: hypothetical protein J1F31_05845 [Erysipelotrichales bacterium]|nr:hypothetical protein [Erysipelotrichales bacterium]
MNVSVMKFGGIAVSTRKNRDYIVNIVKTNQDKILIVASAMGRIGFPYATDTLLELIDENYVDDKEKSRLLATGEIISTIVLSNQLKQNGINSYALSLKELGIYKSHLDVKQILHLFEKYDVLVAPGFLLLNEQGEVETLARGGGDYSAVLLANALNIKKVLLYKDVSGIMPFVFPGYKNIKCYDKLDYLEALSLSDIGYNIIQKDALYFAKEHNISLIVKSFVHDNDGTVISNFNISNKYIGMSFTKDAILIATKNTELLKEELENFFLENRLYFKDVLTNENYLEFKFGVNQLQLAKKRIVDQYFGKFL